MVITVLATLAVCMVAFLAIALYLAAYVLLRLAGTLRVNRHGWHAHNLEIRRRHMLAALFLFDFFQPLMRCESGLRRVLAGLVPGEEQPVAEVVVELVPLA
ncbi:MAG: hypothetical protein LIP23_05000 [Planctomycetes bacterium]|nr:hypothetical protein [Planctomycetota bacterium]